jgi:predicted O-linked N-acetylglucosamine transferase (SPINDLY family)
MHPVARFLLPLLEHQNRDDFEVFAYSSRTLPDGFTAEIAQRVEHWREVAGLNDDALAQQIRSDQIDLLIDLTMHSRDCRPGLFARKPAPVQISYLAYVGTTGLAAMDYRITDGVLDPPEGPPLPFIEQPLRLPRCWWSLMPPPRTTIADVVPPPCLQNGFITFGSLNNFTKVNPPVRALWARLVAGLPQARLLLHVKNGHARGALLQELADHGLPPERVTLIGYQDGHAYMASYGQIDIRPRPQPLRRRHHQL